MELEGIRGIMDWEFFGRSGGRKPFKRFSPPPQRSRMLSLLPPFRMLIHKVSISKSLNVYWGRVGGGCPKSLLNFYLKMENC